jgi:hypothetical protein
LNLTAKTCPGPIEEETTRWKYEPPVREGGDA